MSPPDGFAKAGTTRGARSALECIGAADQAPREARSIGVLQGPPRALRLRHATASGWHRLGLEHPAMARRVDHFLFAPLKSVPKINSMR
jgi:hypothetical protein